MSTNARQFTLWGQNAFGHGAHVCGITAGEADPNSTRTTIRDLEDEISRPQWGCISLLRWQAGAAQG